MFAILIDQYHRDVANPIRRATREAPGDKTQAKGQQEWSQQHQDQGSPVTEGEFDIFETNEKELFHEIIP